MFREYNFKKFDFVLVIIVCLLVLIGITAIGSATQINQGADPSVYNKQIFGFVVSLVIMLILSLIDYRFISKFYPLIYVFNLILLVLVLFLGKEVKGATRWIIIGPITIQPSELAKIFMIIVLARFIGDFYKYLNKIWFLLLLAIITAVPVFLILKEPNLSTTIVFAVIFIITIFSAGVYYRYFVIALIIGVPLFMFTLWYIQQPDQKLLLDYQKDRVMALLNPADYEMEEYLQTMNSIQAIGSGKLYGKGLNQGTLNKYNYLPESQTDFIFAIIGEEFGFFGCAVVLALFLLLILKCLLLAKDTQDIVAKIMIGGYTGSVMFQVFVNIGVTTGLVPNTGITLPFVSAGLSSMLSHFIAIGIILNISIQRKSQFIYEKGRSSNEYRTNRS